MSVIIKRVTLVAVFAEMCFLLAAFLLIFFWQPVNAYPAVFICILAGLINSRSFMYKGFSVFMDIKNLFMSMLKRPGFLLLFAAGLAYPKDTWHFQLIAVVSAILLTLSLSSISFAVAKKRNELLEKILVSSILLTMIAILSLVSEIMILEVFANIFLPSGWLFAIASGDMLMFLLIAVLSLWLFRMRERLLRRELS